MIRRYLISPYFYNRKNIKNLFKESFTKNKNSNLTTL